MKDVFSTKYTLRFQEADLAGIMFFGNIYSIAHGAFEEFIVHKGWRWEEWFRESKIAAPIRHSECNYLSPLFPGEKYQIFVQISHLGESSIRSEYAIVHENSKKLCAIVNLTHAFINIEKKAKTSLPQIVRDRLKASLRESFTPENFT